MPVMEKTLINGRLISEESVQEPLMSYDENIY